MCVAAGMSAFLALPKVDIEKGSFEPTPYEITESYVKKVQTIHNVGLEALDPTPNKCTGGGNSAGLLFVLGDVSGIAQKVLKLFPKQPPLSPAFSMTGSFNILTGYMAYQDGSKKLKVSKRIQDLWGVLISRINMTQGSVDTLTGVVSTATLAFSLAASSGAGKVFAIAIPIFGKVVAGLSAATYILNCIPKMISLFKNMMFERELASIRKNPRYKTESNKLYAEMRYLMQQLSLSCAERTELCCKVVDNPSEIVDKDLEGQELLTRYDKGFIQGFVKAKNLGSREALQMESAFIDLRKKKEAELSRKIGSDALTLLKEEVNKNPKDWMTTKLKKEGDISCAKAFLDKVHGNMKASQRIDFAIIFFSLLGAATFIAATAGTGGIALLVLGLVVTVAMFLIDGYFLNKSYKAGVLDFRDKAIGMVAGFMISSIIVIGTFFSMGTLPLIVAGVIGAIWLFTILYSHYHWIKNEELEAKKVLCNSDEYVAH